MKKFTYFLIDNDTVTKLKNKYSLTNLNDFNVYHSRIDRNLNTVLNSRETLLIATQRCGDQNQRNGRYTLTILPT